MHLLCVHFEVRATPKSSSGRTALAAFAAPAHVVNVRPAHAQQDKEAEQHGKAGGQHHEAQQHFDLEERAKQLRRNATATSRVQVPLAPALLHACSALARQRTLPRQTTCPC